jgi:hypothetical protein
MKNTVLFIDAGHGGIDPIGRYTTAPSKQFKYASGFHQDGWFLEGVSNRQIAAEFIAQASRMGFVCIPVYHPYKDTPLSSRTNLANTISSTLNADGQLVHIFSLECLQWLCKGLVHLSPSKQQQRQSTMRRHSAPSYTIE